MVFVCKCSIFDHEVVYKMGHRGREMNRQKSRGTQWGGAEIAYRAKGDRDRSKDGRNEDIFLFNSLFCTNSYSVPPGWVNQI